MFLELKNRYCIIAVLFFLGTVLQTAPVSPMNPDEVGTVEENERPGAHKALKKLRQKYRKALEEWSSKLEVHDHPGLTSHQRAHVRLELEACEKERKRNFTLEDMDYMNSRIKQLSSSDQVEPYKSYIFDIQLLAGEDNSMRQAYLKELMLVRTKLREMQQDYRETKNWDADQLAEIRIQIEVCDEEYERSYVMALDEEFLRKRESELKTRRAALGQLSKMKRGLICLQDKKPDTTELKSGVMKATKELRKIYSESLDTWLLVLNTIKPIELSEHQRRMYRVQMEECAFQKLQLALRTYHIPYAYMNSRLKLLERNISLKDTPLETLTSKIFPHKLRVAVVDPSDLQDEGKTIENLRKELADTRKQVAERLNQGSSDTGNKEEESSLQDRERALQEKIQEHNKMHQAHEVAYQEKEEEQNQKHRGQLEEIETRRKGLDARSTAMDEEAAALNIRERELQEEIDRQKLAHQAHEAVYQKKEEEQNQKHRDQLEEIETRRKDLDARSTAMDEEAAALNIRERELQEEINRQKMAHQECNASLQKAEDALRHLSHDQEEHGRARCSIDSQSDARSLKRLKVAFIFVCCIFLLLLFLLICLLVYQHRTHNNQGELASFKELLELHVENHDPLVGKTLNSATTSKIGSHSVLLSDNEAEDSVLGDFRLP